MFSKPNAKTVTSAGTTAVAFVVGAKVGDGVAAIMPDSTSSYKKIILGVVGIVAAASVNASTPSGKMAQSAFLGMGAKQLYDEVTDKLSAAVAAKPATTSTNRFVNALVGHETLTLPAKALSGAWLGETNEWDRPQEQEQTLLFSGV